MACHQFTLMQRFDVLKYAKPGSVFLLDLLDRPARPLSVPRGWFIGDIPTGIFIVLGLLLLELGTVLR